MVGTNVGNLLNNRHITWGWFQGGFRDCNQSHVDSQGNIVKDYIPHHEPFQYYASTSNPDHLPPSSIEAIGHQDQANHQYDLEDFWAAASIHNLPAVSYLKPAAYQDGHPEHSSPLSLQSFLVDAINSLQKLPEWKHMAIFIAWDDSGGFYDHEMPPIINQSHMAADALVDPGDAGNPPPEHFRGVWLMACGFPFLVISPFAKENFVGHALIDQTSILRFVEDNWFLGESEINRLTSKPVSANFFDFSKRHSRPLILDPHSGLVTKKKRKTRTGK